MCSFQKKLISQYRSEGWDVVKTIRLNKAGYPDLMLMRYGVTEWVESKEANDTLKPLQKKMIDKLIKNGFKACCIQEGKGVIYPIH